MKPLSRSQVIGVLALLGILVTVTGVTVVRAVVSAAAPGITLHDAFPQAPAAPPPVRPADSLAAAPPRGETASALSSALATTPSGDVVVHVAGAVKKHMQQVRPSSRFGRDGRRF
ncbi:MAG TPA: hypothetical protein VKT32_01665 [Chthonomonadaceae bacterium]|nr:hypothetical protein [Chthonomonadaceae bacterium]